MNHHTIVPENYEQEKSEAECPDCGEMMVIQEGCEKCEHCGYSEC